jgi:hypothetical protein
MATIPQYIADFDGFDGYQTGTVVTNYPWTVTNASFVGSITGGAGAFGTNALVVPVSASNTGGTQYQFPSTMQPIKAGSVSQVFSWSGWISVGTPTVAASDIIVGMGSTATPTSGGIGILGLSYSTTTGLNLLFGSTLSSVISTPYTFAIQPNTYYWVSIAMSFGSGLCTATYAIGGTAIQTNVSISWPADYFTAGQFANTIRFATSRIAATSYDDIVVQAVSSSDANWPGGTVQPSLVPAMPPQQVRNGVAVSNGPILQWAASGALPNYQSATDLSGANTVIASDVSQTDLYNWTATGATSIKALRYKGNSSRYGNVNPQQYISAVQSNFPLINFGPSRFIGISENDGTNAWTATSVAAASFGQESH